MSRTRTRTADQLNAVYSLIPDPGCRGLCQDGCHSYAMQPAEQARIYATTGRRLPLAHADIEEPCPALDTDGRCTVYPVRPAICRLYGAAEGLPCPHGCQPPAGPITDHEAAEILTAIRKIR